jgi:hypothetical protein
MSIGMASRAFAKGLGTAANSRGCTLRYVRGEDGRQRQLLECVYSTSNGGTTAASVTLQGQADVVSAAEQLGASVALEIGG